MHLHHASHTLCCHVGMGTNRVYTQVRGRAAAEVWHRASTKTGALTMLQRRYRAALSGAVVAKARYLAQAGEGFATALSVERARWRWQRIDACRARLAAAIAEVDNATKFARLPAQRELNV